MTRTFGTRALCAIGVGLALLALAGCPSGTTTITGTSSDITTLTSTEEQAIEAALNAMGSLAGASGAVQGVSAGDTLDSGQTQPSETSITFGQCPEISISMDNPSGLTLNLSIDFGDGCTPTGSSVTCAGSAQGTVDQSAQELAVVFDDFRCEDNDLAGSVDVAWTRGTTNVSLDGSWVLDFTDNDYSVFTSGTGQVSFNSSTLATTVSTFVGTIQDDTGSWGLSANSIVTTYAANGNLIPSDGDVTLSGTDIHTVTVFFNSDSPSTGIVQVSVNDGPTFDVNINEL